MTKQELIQAIHNFHADTSRSQAQTREGLEEAASLIDLLMDALDEDAENDSVAQAA